MACNVLVLFYYYYCFIRLWFFHLASLLEAQLNDHDLLRTSGRCWAVWGAEQGSCSPGGNIAGEQWNQLWSPKNKAIWAKPHCNSSSLHGFCTEMCTSLEMLWLTAGNKHIHLKATSRLLDLLLWYFFSPTRANLEPKQEHWQDAGTCLIPPPTNAETFLFSAVTISVFSVLLPSTPSWDQC